LVLSLSALHERGKANFVVVSPKRDYADLLRLNRANIVVPLINGLDGVWKALDFAREQAVLRDKTGENYGKLFIVLDGLEELDGCNKNGDLEEYRNIIDIIVRQPNIEVITGADLIKTIFSGYPGAFVGIGNCLVTAQMGGKADYTFVNDDSSLSMPAPLYYPDAPSCMETVIWANAVQGKPQD
jgi:hypothetical protein